jgi:hypothetical protein
MVNELRHHRKTYCTLLDANTDGRDSNIPIGLHFSRISWILSCLLFVYTHHLTSALLPRNMPVRAMTRLSIMCPYVRYSKNSQSGDEACMMVTVYGDALSWRTNLLATSIELCNLSLPTAVYDVCCSGWRLYVVEIFRIFACCLLAIKSTLNIIKKTKTSHQISFHIFKSLATA